MSDLVSHVTTETLGSGTQVETIHLTKKGREMLSVDAEDIRLLSDAEQRLSDVISRFDACSATENVYAYPRIHAVTDWITDRIRAVWLAVRYGGMVMI